MSAAREVIKLDDGPYFYKDFLREVEDEIQKAELFAYEALKANGYFFVPPAENTENV
jgi:hypothetical protein